ncbi:RluA family pseudouridine synthase [Cohnella caldifontis]|uniref:RluA family pseudouridine synthase n=1 Tax=Cohnella caldifontis TaxID=3027471 RepID=UPI0023EA7B52|nr:RluA family pseudouridine synthase [Cohnella sp. YIM B05605]
MRGTGRNGPRKPGHHGTGDGRGRSAGGRPGAENRRTDKPRSEGRRSDKPKAESFGRKGTPAIGGRGAAADRGRRAASAAVGAAAPLKMGRIKGEWMEIRLPDGLAGAPMQAVLRHVPLPPKLLNKLMHGKGLLLQGATLRLHLFPKERIDFPADWMELNVLYEDEFTLVVGKPAGIEVHPSEQGQRRTLAHAVASYYEMTGQEVRIRHIHRIDKDTTGPVLYAKNEFAHYQYDKDMREKRIERIYLALAEGVIPQDKGTIDKPIGQDRHHSTRRRISETGDPAVTHYEVVERFGGHTLVRLRLETGRTHQIRVHLSAIGHPLAGDGMYGGSRKVMSRQALHGEKLIWRHPWTGEKQQVRAPLPDDFAQALESLRGRGDPRGR